MYFTLFLICNYNQEGVGASLARRLENVHITLNMFQNRCPFLYNSSAFLLSFLCIVWISFYPGTSSLEPFSFYYDLLTSYYRAPTFSTHMPCPPKICFINKIKTIWGGVQLLVTGLQGPVTRVPGVRIPCPMIASPKAQVPVPLSQGPKPQGPRSQSLGSQGPRVLGLRSQGPWSRVPGLRSWF